MFTYFTKNTLRAVRPISTLLNVKSVLISTKGTHLSQLRSILEVFSSNNINLTHISSHPTSQLDYSKGSTFAIDFEYQNEENKSKAILELNSQNYIVREVFQSSSSWFPRKLEDLDNLDRRTLTAGAELESDHPGFNDALYRKRREDIAQIAFTHNCRDREVPRVVYTRRELETWQTIYDVLSPLQAEHACEEYLQARKEMEMYCSFSRNNIPQLDDINRYLTGKTGFRLIPIAGLLCARDFLSFLAFRIFPSTQYIRHHSVPFYTPEPDIVHELIGHAPLFANQCFADFSQQIGLASLGASDEEIKKLATVYWFSVEFGITKNERNERKVYGAGILSSVDEILNAVDSKSKTRFFNPLVACNVDYPITTLQPLYWWSNSFGEAKEMMKEYSSKIDKGFIVGFDRETERIKVYQDVRFN